MFIEVLVDKVCPSCGSRMKPIIDYDDNGIYGPGFQQWIVKAEAECIKPTCRIKVGIDIYEGEEPETENFEINEEKKQ